MKLHKRNKHGIRALFFDVGGVCLTDGWEHGSRQKAAKHFSLDFEEMNRRHHGIFYEFECGRVALHDYLTRVVFYKKRRFSRETFFRFMKNESHPYKTTFDLLKKFKVNGRYLLAVLSNESFDLNNFRIHRFGLQKYFTHFFSSCFLGLRKPDPRMYQIALHVTQRNPREVLYIDDRKENVKAARALKINVIHLAHPERLSDELRAHGIK